MRPVEPGLRDGSGGSAPDIERLPWFWYGELDESLSRGKYRRKGIREIPWKAPPSRLRTGARQALCASASNSWIALQRSPSHEEVRSISV